MEKPFQTRVRKGVQDLLKACDLAATSFKQIRLALEHYLDLKQGYRKDLVEQIIKEELVARFDLLEVQAATDIEGLPVPFGDTEYRGILEHLNVQNAATVWLVVQQRLEFDGDTGKGRWLGSLTLEKSTSNCKIEIRRISTVWKLSISCDTCYMDGTVIKSNGQVAGSVTYNGVEGGKFSLYPVDSQRAQLVNESWTVAKLAAKAFSEQGKNLSKMAAEAKKSRDEKKPQKAAKAKKVAAQKPRDQKKSALPPQVRTKKVVSGLGKRSSKASKGLPGKKVLKTSKKQKGE
eukprot:gnl/MRDRNA2_/MRDRNA2_111601_c0_seq1.p1 gnl/MRDRNA2_/MRDRNA2_111601_c0~~gnl/MRDRNA2_/MRDRNA2_111601_c0_seq1.p1  ORF type:complete len:290 (-),score=69.25 gnl/MRDRNA2_/MRDRNA2_111601_c0_seq1:18-887(-)